jgi:hypothetical protein
VLVKPFAFDELEDLVRQWSSTKVPIAGARETRPGRDARA